MESQSACRYHVLGQPPVPAHNTNCRVPAYEQKGYYHYHGHDWKDLNPNLRRLRSPVALVVTGGLEPVVLIVVLDVT